jgi:hypothetical protein
MFQQEGYDFMAAAFEVYNEIGYGMAGKSTSKASKSSLPFGESRS